MREREIKKSHLLRKHSQIFITILLTVVFFFFHKFNYCTQPLKSKFIAKLFLPSGLLLLTYPSHTPTRLCSRPDKEITERKSISRASTVTGTRQAADISQTCHWASDTERFTAHLPAMTVLFPSSTTRGSRDRDESITFPSISLPWTVTHAMRGTRWWHFTASFVWICAFGGYFIEACLTYFYFCRMRVSEE